jgi:hypothetical protein
MNHPTRLRLLRQHHGLPIPAMAELLGFGSGQAFQEWHQRHLGDIYHPVITKGEHKA